MVVKVAEYTGTLNCKNCVIVPYSSKTSANNSDIFCEIQKKPKNISHCGSQTISTTYFHQQNLSAANKTEQLWHKQFTRWWTWNWQRKRASLLKKLGKKHFQNEIPKKCVLTKNKSIECDLTPDTLQINENKVKDTIYTTSLKNGQLHQVNYDCEQHIDRKPPLEQFIPVFAKCSSEMKRSFKSRRKRNKHKERVYEGWMREVCSSDTETSETDVVVKGTSTSKKHENRMHYLSLRLRKLNSELFIGRNSRENVAEYKSPISGKKYNLNLSKTQTYNLEPDETCHLKSKACADKEFLAKPEFECTAQYHQIRNEHFQLLKSICEIVNNNQTEIITENLVESTKFNKCVEGSDLIEFDSNKDVHLKESSNLYANIESDGFMPNISRSLPIFMEENPREINKIKYEKKNYSFDACNDDVSTSSFFDLRKIEDYYDINYLYNNLDVFKSSITETSFIWDYIEKNEML